MRNVAIVEDNDNDAAVLTAYINDFGKANGIDFHIDRFVDPIAFFDTYRPIYAVVFLDVEMPRQDGVSASKRLRQIDKTVSLIFVTNLVQYAQKGYEVDAIAYLIKPVRYYDFSLCFRKAIDIYVSLERRDFNIKTASGLARVSTEKLVYVEVARHRLYYHLVDDVLEVTGALGKVEEELKEFGFLRCNQCYLVNPRFITGIKGNDLLIGGVVLLISRPRKSAFLEELAKWYAGGEGRQP
ncbi:MAG: LytTR family DNA-binding domain-containing protein [Bacilli bacterium]|nr:LytTR family DNA-binding domain-containing protein [Bacilli bacterium]